MRDNYKKLLKARIENINAVFPELGLELYVSDGWKQINSRRRARFSAGTYKQAFELLCAYNQGVMDGQETIKNQIANLL